MRNCTLTWSFDLISLFLVQVILAPLLIFRAGLPSLLTVGPLALAQGLFLCCEDIRLAVPTCQCPIQLPNRRRLLVDLPREQHPQRKNLHSALQSPALSSGVHSL